MQLFTTHQQAEFVAALLRLVSPEEVPRGFGGVEIPGGSPETLPLTPYPNPLTVTRTGRLHRYTTPTPTPTPTPNPDQAECGVPRLGLASEHLG